jgi:hypothetical protein
MRPQAALSSSGGLLSMLALSLTQHGPAAVDDLQLAEAVERVAGSVGLKSSRIRVPKHLALGSSTMEESTPIAAGASGPLAPPSPPALRVPWRVACAGGGGRAGRDAALSAGRGRAGGQAPRMTVRWEKQASRAGQRAVQATISVRQHADGRAGRGESRWRQGARRPPAGNSETQVAAGRQAAGGSAAGGASHNSPGPRA